MDGVFARPSPWRATRPRNRGELRATTSLARLLRDTARREEARAMLAELYGWFTGGFDTADLKDAKALLEELAIQVRIARLKSLASRTDAFSPGIQRAPADADYSEIVKSRN